MSLRDVERAMVVFKFFIDKMSLFKDLIADKAKDEVRSILLVHLQNTGGEPELIYVLHNSRTIHFSTYAQQ